MIPVVSCLDASGFSSDCLEREASIDSRGGVLAGVVKIVFSITRKFAYKVIVGDPGGII
jgi:hypothetical protein